MAHRKRGTPSFRHRFNASSLSSSTPIYVLVSVLANLLFSTAVFTYVLPFGQTTFSTLLQAYINSTDNYELRHQRCNALASSSNPIHSWSSRTSLPWTSTEEIKMLFNYPFLHLMVSPGFLINMFNKFKNLVSQSPVMVDLIIRHIINFSRCISCGARHANFIVVVESLYRSACKTIQCVFLSPSSGVQVIGVTLHKQISPGSVPWTRDVYVLLWHEGAYLTNPTYSSSKDATLKDDRFDNSYLCRVYCSLLGSTFIGGTDIFRDSFKLRRIPMSLHSQRWLLRFVTSDGGEHCKPRLGVFRRDYSMSPRRPFVISTTTYRKHMANTGSSLHATDKNGANVKVALSSTLFTSRLKTFFEATRNGSASLCKCALFLLQVACHWDTKALLYSY